MQNGPRVSAVNQVCFPGTNFHMTHREGQIVLFGNWDMPVISDVVSFAFTTPSGDGRAWVYSKGAVSNPLPSSFSSSPNLATSPQIDQFFYLPVKIISLVHLYLQSARIASHLSNNLQLGWGSLHAMWTILDRTFHLGMPGGSSCL